MSQLIPNDDLIDRELSDVQQSLVRLAGERDEAGRPTRQRLSALLGDTRYDPDVQRLIEAMTYLSAWHRAAAHEDVERLDARRLAAVAPHLLEPVPSAAMIALEPEVDQAGIISVASGSPVASASLDGRSCYFRIANNVELVPVELRAVRADVAADARLLTVMLDLHLCNNADYRVAFPRWLRVHVAGGDDIASSLLGMLLDRVSSVSAQWLGKEGTQGLAQGASDASARIRPVGFETFNRRGYRPASTLHDWPVDACEGERLLSEAAVFPEKFAFVDLPIPKLPAPPPDVKVTGMRLQLQVERRADDVLRPDDELRRRLRLNAVPAVNLYQSESDPMALAPGRDVVIETGDGPGREVVRVDALRRPDGVVLSPEHFEVIRRVRHGRVETSLRLPVRAGDADGESDGAWVASLTCCDGAAAAALNARSICKPLSGGPKRFVGFGRITPRLLPPVGGKIARILTLWSTANGAGRLSKRRIASLLSLCGRDDQRADESTVLDSGAITRIASRHSTRVRSGMMEPIERLTVYHTPGRLPVAGLPTTLCRRLLRRALAAKTPGGTRLVLRLLTEQETA
jgi:type VI secretion system protein ImpG